MPARVSVIIPTFNGWLTLPSTLNSLAKQALKPTEIIVVNNGSTDQTATLLPKLFPQVKLISLNRNTGVTGGRNAGIKAVNRRSQYLLFFDHDMVADPDMLRNLIQVLDSNSKFGVVTPKICYLKKKDQIWAAGTNINLWTGQVLFRGGVDLGQFDKQAIVQVAPAAMLVKRAVLDRVRAFDNRYFATYEDTDFCFRAKQAGFLTVYTPYALSYHDILPDLQFTARRLLDRAYWVGRNRVLFMHDFGRSFLVFLLISPIYFMYFLYLGTKHQDLKGVIDYCRGFMVGLKDCLVEKKYYG